MSERVDKNQAVIDFLLQCPTISDNSIFFNYINAEDDNKQIVTQSTDTVLHSKYVDGSVMKQFTFSIIDFRSITQQPIPKAQGYSSENVEEMFDVQGIIDWVYEQRELRNFPNFGSDCVVDDIYTTTETPNLDGVDTSLSSPLAKYSMSIKIDYLDISKMLWTN